MPSNLLHVGHVVVPTFGLLAALGLLGAIVLSLRTAAVADLSPDQLWNAGLFAVLAAFVSSRLLLVAVSPRSFLAAPILLLMQPSLTAAGLLVTGIAVAVYLRLHRLPIRRSLDAWAAPGALLWAFLCLGHLAEGSDPGLPTRRGLRTSLAGYREHPIALYAAVLALLLAVWLFRRLHRPHAPGLIAAQALALGGALQFLLSFLRLPYLYQSSSPWSLFDPIQWFGLGLLLAGCLLALPALAVSPASGSRLSPHVVEIVEKDQ